MLCKIDRFSLAPFDGARVYSQSAGKDASPPSHLRRAAVRPSRTRDAPPCGGREGRRPHPWSCTDSTAHCNHRLRAGQIAAWDCRRQRSLSTSVALDERGAMRTRPTSRKPSVPTAQLPTAGSPLARRTRPENPRTPAGGSWAPSGPATLPHVRERAISDTRVAPHRRLRVWAYVGRTPVSRDDGSCSGRRNQPLRRVGLIRDEFAAHDDGDPARQLRP